MKRIAFIAHKEYCGLMRFTGFECFEVLGKREVPGLIKELKEKEYALIFVSQDVAPSEKDFDQVVVLPGILEEGKSEEYLKEEIRRAVGGDISLSVES